MKPALMCASESWNVTEQIKNLEECGFQTKLGIRGHIEWIDYQQLKMIA